MKLNKSVLKFFVIPLLFTLQSARADLPDFIDTVRNKAGLYTLKYAKVGGIGMGMAVTLACATSVFTNWNQYNNNADEPTFWGPKGKYFSKFIVSAAMTALAGYATYKLYHFDVHNFHSGAVG